jgi:adenosylcobinamide kinase/adenosylcobinamide-phosphate guanylyltransferase
VTTAARLTFILGGARSGKSGFAEQLASGSGLQPVYIATAEPLDPEMQQRIDRHRSRRDQRWRTIEAPLELPTAIWQHAGTDRFLVIDCLTLWLTNLILAGRDVESESDRLLAALAETEAAVAVVSNEVGLGIVPLGELSRQFVDATGRLHQSVAAAAGRVVMMVAGLPLELKPGKP